MKLYNSLDPQLIQLDSDADDKEEFLRQLIGKLNLKVKQADELLEKLMERERQGSTSIGNHSAVPHTKMKSLKEPVVAIGISKQGFLYHKNDPEPVHLIILILSPSQSPVIHLQILAAAASLVKKGKPLINDLLAVSRPVELINIVTEYEMSKENRDNYG